MSKLALSVREIWRPNDAATVTNLFGQFLGVRATETLRYCRGIGRASKEYQLLIRARVHLITFKSGLFSVTLIILREGQVNHLWGHTDVTNPSARHNAHCRSISKAAKKHWAVLQRDLKCQFSHGAIHGLSSCYWAELEYILEAKCPCLHGFCFGMRQSKTERMRECIPELTRSIRCSK